jgi:hypothetical protein
MAKLSLTFWIFVGMAVGVAIGVAAPQQAVHLSVVSNIFLRLIKSIIAPLLFGTLVYGIAASGNVKTMGRIGLKSILYFAADRIGGGEHHQAGCRDDIAGRCCLGHEAADRVTHTGGRSGAHVSRQHH